MRAYVSSLGCKLNQSEMEALAAELARAGHQIVTAPTEAELCILNTCAVTAVAAQKSRQALRRLNRDNPAARLVVTGCYAELEPEVLRNLPGVELVVGNAEKEQLAACLAGQLTPSASDASRWMPDVSGLTPASLYAGVDASHPRTRALVKVQDGCDNACTYCLIHLARGPQRSRPADQVLEEIRWRLAAGYQEVVLTGVHIGAYGRDRGLTASQDDLWALASRILAETDLPRLRLSSIEPWDLPEQALQLWQDARLCRHLHLPLQSGCDATLQRMGRHYSTSQFASLVAAARAAIPDLAVTTDVIVGFPGETDGEFADSISFVRETAFARVHTFPFSRRPGTLADQMPGQVPPLVKAERARAVQAVAAASNWAFRQRFVGRTMDVLWESCRAGEAGLWNGLTGNYLRVDTTSTESLRNQRTPTRLLALTACGLRGQIEAKESGG